MAHPLARAALALAILLAAWLRLHGLGDQVLLDDEWHALHKLMTSSYREILTSIGRADHSIPLTLLYKAMASAVGLTEIDMRALQVACGIALVPLAAAIAWRASRSAMAAALAAFLVAGAPFLVLYSRLARPYAITTLCVAAMAALLWSWRARRTLRMGAAILALTVLASWLHPVTAVFPAVALLFVFFEDLRDRRAAGPIVALGIACALGIAAVLGPPLAADPESLAVKAGGEHPGAFTLWRMAAIFAGGFADAGTVAIAALAAFGAWRCLKEDRRLGTYLVALFAAPIAVVALVGAVYSAQGHTFARYVMPAQVVFLAWAAVGAVALVSGLVPPPKARAGVVAALAIAYLALGPAIRQVATLGPWYSHTFHNFDYSPRHNVAARQYDGFPIPAFYRELAAMAPGSAPIVEAPFSFNAPGNPVAYFSGTHRQPQLMGFIHDACLSGPYYGEVPKEARFAFRDFVFVDDPASLRARGARFLLLHLDLRQGVPFAEAPACLEALTRIYGPPARREPRLAVFDLREGPQSFKMR